MSTTTITAAIVTAICLLGWVVYEWAMSPHGDDDDEPTCFG